MTSSARWALLITVLVFGAYVLGRCGGSARAREQAAVDSAASQAKQATTSFETARDSAIGSRAATDRDLRRAADVAPVAELARQAAVRALAAASRADSLYKAQALDVAATLAAFRTALDSAQQYVARARQQAISDSLALLSARRRFAFDSVALFKADSALAKTRNHVRALELQAGNATRRRWVACGPGGGATLLRDRTVQAGLVAACVVPLGR